MKLTITGLAEYISKAPWYLDTGAPSLAHQRRPDVEEPVKTDLNSWYARGQRAGPAATKYRKGACENCGAMTHKRQDCMERPRKKGAKFTGKNIAADEILQDFDIGFDAKRDRWNGYDAAEHRKIYDEYAAIEAARQKIREEEIDNQTSTDLAAAKKVAKAGAEKDPEFGSSDEDDDDEEKYADAADAVGQKLDTKTRITVRNLRIREDTAKYLINLDPESAYYDPKTRSMRDAPDKTVGQEEVGHTPALYCKERVLNPFRHGSRVITSYDIPVTLSLHKTSRCSLGKHLRRATMSTYTRTPPLGRSTIKNTPRSERK